MIQGPQKKIHDQVEQKLLSIITKMLLSLDKKRAAETLSLQSRLSQDLGIDSLGRVELFHQIEDAFGVYLPQSLLAEAETVQDIADNLQSTDVRKDLLEFVETEDLSQIKVSPHDLTSLKEILIKRGTVEASRVHIYYQDESGKEHPITYGELLKKSTEVAASFTEMGLLPGETVAIMLPTSKEFFYTFMGAMLAGLVAVPIYPPLRPDKIEEYALREAIILKNAQVRVMVTFDRAEKLSSLLKVFIPSLKTVTTAQALLNGGSKIPSVKVTGSSPAFIQYTSGSTSSPKGVLLSHDNLLANIRAISQVIHIKPGDVGVSWLPLYHDMGLIGCWLTSFYNATPIVIMSPLAFLSRPERWLWSIHYHRATLSAAPNFAYELCVKKIKPQAIEGLDLSSWRLSFNGAEAINPQTLINFYETFKHYGLHETTIYPAYGLAENSVALALPEPGAKPIIDTISKEAFETKQEAIEAKEGEDSLQFVCEGVALPGHEIKVVDEHGKDVPERVIGRVIFKGPSMMQGYYRNPEATQAAMVGDYIDSGDYGYLAEGQLYITGRRKDLIIKAGRNYYPEEIEQVVAKIEGTRKGCIIAFGMVDDQLSTEKLVIVAEHKLTQKSQHPKLIAEITEQVGNAVGIPPDEVILISPGTIPKTSSGKLQRSKCKQLVEQRQLKAKKPMWMQMASLGLKASAIKSWSGFKKVMRGVYSAYVYAMVAISLPLLWLVALLLPRVLGRPVIKGWVRMVMVLIGMPVFTKHIKWPKQKGVYVANHASYLDAVVLFCTLPSQVYFIGKKEVFGYPFIGRIAKTMGTITVDRYDFTKNLEDTKKITTLVEQGKSIAIFPEGTFTHMPGIRAFKLGAFRIAADTNTPIIPIAIAGTRHNFRGTNKLLCPGAIHLSLCKPIENQGRDWNEVTRLTRASRQALSEALDEPLIDM